MTPEISSRDRSTDRQRPRLDNLQVLRAFAALAVVHVHTGITYGSWHTPGTFGVDIFFVLSGFIMAMICAGEGDAFLVKRLTRIVPPYWALTLISYAGLRASPGLDPTSPRGIGPLLKSLFFIPYARTNGDLDPLLGAGWTLNYEMSFYVVLALALVLWKKRADLLGIALLAGLMLLAHFAPPGVFASFYGRPILWEFIAGIGAFHLYRWMKPEWCRRLRMLFLVLIPTAIVFLCWYEGTRFYHPGGTRLWFGVPAYVLLQSVVLLSRAGYNLTQRLLVLIGDSSYTLYLLHLLVFSLLHHEVTRFAPWLQVNRPVGCFFAIVVATASAIAIYRFIELPVHRRLNRWLVPSTQSRTPR